MVWKLGLLAFVMISFLAAIWVTFQPIVKGQRRIPRWVTMVVIAMAGLSLAALYATYVFFLPPAP
jgi:hypothetical protein